jgi:esterase
MAKLFYKKYGTQGPFVIIVHGLFGMLDNWHSIAQKMQDQFQIIAVDQRNHGHSPHTDSMTYDEMAGDIDELMVDLGIEKAHLVGHSMGGKTVMQFANLYPQKIDKLVVVDIAPKAYPNGHAIYFKALFEIIDSTIESRKQAEAIMDKYVDEPSIKQFLLKSLYRSTNGTYTLRMNVKAIYNYYAQISGEIASNWPLSNDVLFIRGEHSNYILPADENTIYEFFPNCEIITIPKAGHWVHAENPDAFVEVLSKFLLT